MSAAIRSPSRVKAIRIAPMLVRQHASLARRGKSFIFSLGLTETAARQHSEKCNLPQEEP
jgi:hypothetical protein